MATYSAQCSAVGSFEHADNFKLYVVLTNRDGNPVTNKSYVDYNVYCQASGYGSINAKHQLYFWIAGSLIRNEIVNVNVPSPNAYIGIASGSIEVEHESDGKKSIVFEAIISASNYGVYAKINENFELTTIPRASSISCSSANIGSNPTVAITSASSSFRHHVTATLGSETVVVLTDTPGGTYTTWKIPDSFYKQIPNAKSAKATMKCETYSGTTLIGTKTIEFEITTSESACRPTVSATIKDTNSTTIALTGNANKLIRYKSTAQLVITSTVKNSAKIKSVTVNGTNVGTSGTITLNYSNVSTASFKIVVTDSRGYTNTSYVVTPSYVNYIPLTVNANFFRPQPTTGEVQLTYSGNYFNDSFGQVHNELALTWDYKEKTSSEWVWGGVWLTPDIEGNTITQQTISLGTDFDYQKDYNFRMAVIDKLNNYHIYRDVSVGMPVFYWGKDFLRATKKFIVDGEIVKNDGYLPVYRGATTNFNEAVTHGFYSFSGTNIEGSPISGQVYGTLEVIVQRSQTWVASNYSLFIWQIYRDTTGKEFHRFGVNESTMSAWRRIYKETSLYTNSSGTSGTISNLAESSANFEYIEILYGDSANGSAVNSVKVYKPNGKVVATTVCTQSGTDIRVNTRKLTISGTSITPSHQQVNFVPGGATYAVNEQLIYKVVGYR